MLSILEDLNLFNMNLFILSVSSPLDYKICGHRVFQIVFFIIGIIFLIFSVVIDYAVINEINLIVGWVAICEVIEISINIDRQQNINRKLMKKILNCNIHINNI